MPAVVCPSRGSCQDLPRRTGPTSPSTPSCTPCCSPRAQMGLAPFRLPPSTYSASPSPSPPGPLLPPTKAPVQEHPDGRMGQGSARSGQVPIPPLAQAPRVHGPRQVLRRPPPPDEIWEELPPRPPFWGQRRLHHLPQAPECPRDIRARHPPLLGQGACQDPPPSGAPRHRPDSPVWSSASLLGTLAGFIMSTATAFPPGMFSPPSSSTSSISSRSFNVVSFGYLLSSQES